MNKLAIVSSSYFPFAGGQELGLEDLICGLRQHADCDVVVITPRFDRRAPAQEVRRNIRIHRYPTTIVPYPRALFSREFNLGIHTIYGCIFVPPLLDKFKPDCVLAYFLSPTAFPSVRWARAKNIPSAVFIGGSDVYQQRWPIGGTTRYSLTHSDHLIATSRFVRDCARMNFDAQDKPFSIVPYSIDLEPFAKEHKERSSPLRVLCVQRLVPSKGTLVLLRALRRLLDRGVPMIGVDIVGDGPERANLEQATDSFGLRNYVLFHGEQSRQRVIDLFKESHIFCFPTLSEGFGIVLLEAMAAENIIIASNCTAIPEVVRHNETGLLFDAGDDKDLASKLEGVIRQPSSFRHLAAAAKLAVTEFELSLVGKRLAELLQELCEYRRLS